MDVTMKPLKALGDESRVKILWMLEERPLCVCEIQTVLGLSQPSVSRHLQLLEEAGFVVSERRGNWKDYELNPSPGFYVQGLLALIRGAALAEPEGDRMRAGAVNASANDICNLTVA